MSIIDPTLALYDLEQRVRALEGAQPAIFASIDTARAEAQVVAAAEAYSNAICDGHEKPWLIRTPLLQAVDALRAARAGMNEQPAERRAGAVGDVSASPTEPGAPARPADPTTATTATANRAVSCLPSGGGSSSQPDTSPAPSPAAVTREALACAIKDAEAALYKSGKRGGGHPWHYACADAALALFAPAIEGLQADVKRMQAAVEHHVEIVCEAEAERDALQARVEALEKELETALEAARLRSRAVVADLIGAQPQSAPFDVEACTDELARNFVIGEAGRWLVGAILRKHAGPTTQKPATIDARSLYEALQATNVLGGFESWGALTGTMRWRFTKAAERLGAPAPEPAKPDVTQPDLRSPTVTQAPAARAGEITDLELADEMDRAWCLVSDCAHVATALLGSERLREGRLARARRARALLAGTGRMRVYVPIEAPSFVQSERDREVWRLTMGELRSAHERAGVDFIMCPLSGIEVADGEGEAT